MPRGNGVGPPSDPVRFTFACQCLNLRIEGLLPASSPLASSSTKSKPKDNDVEGLQRIWLPKTAERINQPAYVSWESDNFRPGRSGVNKNGELRKVDADEDVEDEGTSWRKCWICGIRCYSAKGQKQDSPAISEQWTEIKPSQGILWGEDLDEELGEPSSPFLSLNIPLPENTTSNFGRPPQTAAPTVLYPPRPKSPTDGPVYLIPPVHDPFFLPPPFIPSHPHLRQLCSEAVVYLQSEHRDLENEVKEFISRKARQMRSTEDRVRLEVETLWEKYQDMPGVKEELERSRSSSATRGDTSKDRRRSVGRMSGVGKPTMLSPPNLPAPGTSSNNPILNEALMSPTYITGSSLLSASINSYAAPPRPQPSEQATDKVDTDLQALSRTLPKNSDARAVAMSHVFSTLDDAMSGKQPSNELERVSSRTRDREIEAEFEEEMERAERDKNEKDSWIDGERRLLDRRNLGTDSHEDSPSRTPRPSDKQTLQQDKGKDKGRVKFEEPSRDESPRRRDDEDDYVFDFELDDGASASNPSVPIPKYDQDKAISRTRNMIEDNLSRTFAADAPSHRAAWKKFERNQSIVHSLRRTTTDSDGSVSNSEYADEASISKLATSVPVGINIRKSAMKRRTELPPMERKTSLSDREGILVPPLMAAMRQRGIGANSLGLSANDGQTGLSGRTPTREDAGRSSRTASASREREQARSYAGDPGAAFESMADEAVDSDEGDGEDDHEGTLRDSRLLSNSSRPGGATTS